MWANNPQLRQQPRTRPPTSTPSLGNYDWSSLTPVTQTRLQAMVAMRTARPGHLFLLGSPLSVGVPLLPAYGERLPENLGNEELSREREGGSQSLENFECLDPNGKRFPIRLQSSSSWTLTERVLTQFNSDELLRRAEESVSG